MIGLHSITVDWTTILERNNDTHRWSSYALNALGISRQITSFFTDLSTHNISSLKLKSVEASSYILDPFRALVQKQNISCNFYTTTSSNVIMFLPINKLKHIFSDKNACRSLAVTVGCQEADEKQSQKVTTTLAFAENIAALEMKIVYLTIWLNHFNRFVSLCSCIWRNLLRFEVWCSSLINRKLIVLWMTWINFYTQRLQ